MGDDRPYRLYGVAHPILKASSHAHWMRYQHERREPVLASED